MSRKGSGRPGIRASVVGRASVLLFAAASITACVTNERNENEGRPPPGDRFVIVHLTDDGIEMPSSIPAGVISFEVENNGDEDHGFVIEGPGVSERLEELDPGERGVATVTITPGTYTVYSPVDSDREDGLEATLQVTEAPPSDEPAEQPGVGPSDVVDPIEDEGQ